MLCYFAWYVLQPVAYGSKPRTFYTSIGSVGYKTVFILTYSINEESRKNALFMSYSSIHSDSGFSVKMGRIGAPTPILQTAITVDTTVTTEIY